MQTEFKVQDKVELLHADYCPTMTISEINEEKQEAKCFWYDSKERRVVSQTIPLNILKHPETIDAEDLLRAFGR